MATGYCDTIRFKISEFLTDRLLRCIVFLSWSFLQQQFGFVLNDLVSFPVIINEPYIKPAL